MKKRTASLILTVIMIFSCIQAVFSDSSDFIKRYDYTDEIFGDVKTDDWFYENVKSVYEFGLMNGKGQKRFDPTGNVTIAETLTIAARIHSIYTTGSDSFEKSDPWYKVYLDYCTNHGILKENFEDLNSPATREVFASILVAALPSSELPEINNVADGAIPDVDYEGNSYADSIYTMYRAGITMGSDSKGTFNPLNNIRRSEVAAIATRMIEPELRQSVALASMKIYVSADGNDKTGDGSKDAPYATLERALERARKVDKENESGIDIIVSEGVYQLSGTIRLTSEDSGTEDCFLRIIGDGKAKTKFVGGSSFSSSDFTKGVGNVMLYFPESVREKIVMLDLKNYGYDLDEINEMISSKDYLGNSLLFTKDGEIQKLAAYPNDSWVNFTDGWMLDQYGEITDKTDNDNDPEHEAKKYVIRYGEEHFDRVTSWHSIEDIHVTARLNQLWCNDNTVVESFDPNEDLMILPYTGGYNPVKGAVLYWYNIPEELDNPGEYYLTREGILYYLPGDDFETATFSVPYADGIIDIDGADHIIIENIGFESSKDNGITVNADWFTLKNCEISAINGDSAVEVTGSFFDISGNTIHDCSNTGIMTTAGDIATLKDGQSTIYNNEVYDFGLISWPYTTGIGVYGVGTTASHNYVHDSKTRGIYWLGANIIIEYNEVGNVLTAADDIGAVSTDGKIQANNIIRYNYIHDIGAVGALANISAINPDYPYYGCAGIYGDFGASYFEAYGNVIGPVNGNGFQVGGRNISIHNNLVLGCSRWYIWVTSIQYADYFKYGKDGSARMSYPDYIYSPAWKKANPDLAYIITDMSQTIADDPRAWGAPVGNVVKDNWNHFDKFGRAFSNWGVSPYSIEDTVYQFSGDDIDVSLNEHSNGNVSTYNSRRGTLDLKSVIENDAADFVDMDWERFQTIGLVD